MSFERQGGAPRTGRSGRSPALERRGREVRGRADASVAAGGVFDVGTTLRVVDGVLEINPARDPGPHKVRTNQTADQRIAALENYVLELHAALVSARMLSR